MDEQDVVSTKRAVENYSNADATFPSTREAKFLDQIVEAFDAGDSEAFVGAVQEFDRLTKLVRSFILPFALLLLPTASWDGRVQLTRICHRIIGKLPSC